MINMEDMKAGDGQRVERSLRVTKNRLGLTLSELKDTLARHKGTLPALKDRHAVRHFLERVERIERANGLRPFTGPTFREARQELGLTPLQMLAVLGMKATPSMRSHISQMETGKKAINPAAARLLRAYLSGYRPIDWPEEDTA